MDSNNDEFRKIISNQNLHIFDVNWKIEIDYSKEKNKNEEIDYILELQGSYYEVNPSLFIFVTEINSGKTKTIEINGIDGGFYLYLKPENENYQTVKLYNNCLIMSLGFTLLSIDLTQPKLKWAIRPDSAEIFEFSDYDGDMILRGEMQIHRIEKSGNVKWSFGGRDIWVNMEGKSELNLEKDKIRLYDFDSNEYLINYDGKLLEDNPRIIKTKKPTFFSNPKRWFLQKVWQQMTKKETK
jgi:hypothetical protein